MSALKVLWMFNPSKKHRQNKVPSNSSTAVPLERSSSNQQVKHFTSSSDSTQEFSQFRRRAKTFTGSAIESKPVDKRRYSNIDQPRLPRQKSDEVCYEKGMAYLEDMQMTLTSPRHYLRRRALVQEELQDDIKSPAVLRSANGHMDLNLESSSSFIINLQVEGQKVKEVVEARSSHSLLDLIDFMLVKNDIDLEKSIADYSITTMSLSTPGQSVGVCLDSPSLEYAGHVLTVTDSKVADGHPQITNSHNKEEEKKPREFRTVQDCLDYFDEHGLVELMAATLEEDSYQLPRVTPLEPIARDWEELPISPEARRRLSDKEMEQQRALWELIYNEHSHLKTLETIINVFMRCLELIHRAKVFSEDNYHNIFGYMEDLYHAHDQFWTYTFEPCLNKTYETKLPLDINEVLNRFPESFGEHFEIYEQHCTLDSLNLGNLQKATNNPEFNTYLTWCELRSECNRQKLKEMLAKPMQQLTRYHLLLNAINKKTTNKDHRDRLEKIVEEVTTFVHTVDNILRMQEETERVKDAMSRITAYSVGDVPHELKELVQSYTHLDLLTPMPDVDVDKPRLLMLEGSLHYRDGSKPKMSAVYVFLFTDMLLITKAIRKSSTDKYKVIHAPHKITSLVVRQLTSESICCLVVNEYNVLSSWFILKAGSPPVAEEWFNQITAAQQFYQDAVSKKAHTWKLMENLRSERILNGVENLDSLSASLSQSLWSINSLSSTKNKGDQDWTQRSSTPSLLQPHQVQSKPDQSLTTARRTKMSKYKNFRSLTGSVDLSNALALQRTTSLGGIMQKKPSTPSIGGLRRNVSPNAMTKDMSKSTNFIRNPRGNTKGNHWYSLHHDRIYGRDMVQHNPAEKSPISDTSSTEDSDMLWDENRRGTFLSDHRSASLPRPTRAKKLPLTKSLSHSPVNLNDSLDFVDLNLSLKDLNSQILFKHSKALPSILKIPPKSKNTKEDGPLSQLDTTSQRFRDVDRSTPSPSQSPTSNRPSSMTKDLGSVQLENTVARKKCHSLGSLDTPEINNLLQCPSSQEIYSNRKSLPCVVEDCKKDMKNLVRNLSNSEGSLWEKSDSCFNVVYTYSRSQKPNVETVDEEEESTRNKYENREMEVEELADVSMASSTCTEVPLHKSCEKLDSETDHVQTSDESDNSEALLKQHDKLKDVDREGSEVKKDLQGKLKCVVCEKLCEDIEVNATDTPQPTSRSVLLLPKSNEAESNTSCESLEKAGLESKSSELLGSNKSSHIGETSPKPSEKSELRSSESELGHPLCSEPVEDSVPTNIKTLESCHEHLNGDLEVDKVTNAKCLSYKEEIPPVQVECSKSPESSNPSKSLFNIPEMAISDVDSAKPEFSSPRVEYIFKDMKEMTSFSETDSDFECDQTPREKFMLLHGWRTFESVSVESDDLSSPGSSDELKFAIAEKKAFLKPETAYDNKTSTLSPVCIDNSKTLNQESTSALGSAKLANNTPSTKSASTTGSFSSTSSSSPSHHGAVVHTATEVSGTSSDLVPGVASISSNTPVVCISTSTSIPDCGTTSTSASDTSNINCSPTRFSPSKTNTPANDSSTNVGTSTCGTSTTTDIPVCSSSNSPDISSCDTQKRSHNSACGGTLMQNDTSLSGVSAISGTSISTIKRGISHSPALKKKAATSSYMKKQEKLTNDDPNSKSKVKQLSQMFEGRQQTPKESTSNASPSHRLEAMKRANCSPTMRAKTKFLESSAQQATTSKTRMTTNSKIPTAGDRKTRALNGQVKKESFKSPEPLVFTDRLLPPKPTYRSKQPRTLERSTKQAVTESAKIQSDARSAFRASSTPIRTKINDLSESPVQKRKQDCSEDLGTKSHRVQDLKSLESPKRKVRSHLKKEYSFVEGTCEVRSNGTNTSSTSRQKTEQEHHVGFSSVQESKSKPSTAVLAPRNRTSSVQVPKPLPRKKLELKDCSGGDGQVPQPKPRSSAGIKTKPSPQWDLFRKPLLLEHRARPAPGQSKPPGTTQSARNLTSSQVCCRQVGTLGSFTEAVSNTNTNNNSGTDEQQVALLAISGTAPPETEQESTVADPDIPILQPRRRHRCSITRQTSFQHNHLSPSPI